MDEKFSLLLKKTAGVFIDVILLFFVFVYLNISAAFETQFPDVTLFTGQAWRISTGCGLVVAVMFLILYRQGKLKELLFVWKKSHWLILFLVFSVLSLLWTVSFSATLYELMLLFFATFSASYLAVRYQVSGFIDVISWIGACCVLVSLFLVFFTPYGIMLNEPFVGSWRGLFWHRNHAGSLMAFFNMIFLLRILLDRHMLLYSRLLCVLFYGLTAVHVFGSKSAAGILLFLFLNMMSLVAWLWMNFHHNITAKKYYIFGFISLTGFVVFISNLDFFFGLLGRSANMTGRVPLWKDLFLNFYLSKPFLGYGYGALWMQENFRILMQIRHDWTYPVYFADNGFLDILLNLGLVGLVLFSIMLFTTFYKNIKRITKTYSWLYIFTFMILVYVVLANLAYSFLLEVDHFVWACLIVVVFLMQQPEGEFS